MHDNNPNVPAASRHLGVDLSKPFTNAELSIALRELHLQHKKCGSFDFTTTITDSEDSFSIDLIATNGGPHG